MFIDRVKITIKAGDGGNGAVAFHREKYVPNGGPDGGDGGNGGSILFKAVDNKNSLIDFHFKKKFVASHGGSGGGDHCNGKCGENVLIEVPTGTIIRDAESNEIIADMFYVGEEKVVLKGGRGGRGNARFKTSKRQAPSFSQNGEKIEPRQVVLELKTIADVGLVGLPNAGKSTLLSKITDAKPKIANYHFTTLSPNLGVVKYYDDSFVVADIPGLIEGASAGAGLGHYFLRHIERTRMIIHVVDMSDSEGNNPYDSYMKINHELKAYSEILASKLQIVACNKMDDASSKKNYQEFIKKVGKKVKCFAVSALTGEGLKQLIDQTFEMLGTIEKVKPLEFEPFEYHKEDITKYDIIKNDDGYFEVFGPFINFLDRAVNLDDVDSFNYFQRMLRDNSVIARLKTMGVQNGDIIVLGDIEFEFLD